jgi:hypothetical protein
MTMTFPRLIQKARSQLHAITGLDLASTVSARKQKDGWHVLVEVVEKKSLPDSQDILATYEMVLDEEANFANFTRVGMRRRNDTVAQVGAELEV